MPVYFANDKLLSFDDALACHGQRSYGLHCMGVNFTATELDCLLAGDYTGPQPCGDVDFKGQSITVYDPSWLVGNNDEIVW